MIWTILFIALALVTLASVAFLIVRGKGFEAAMRLIITNAKVLDELAKKSPNKIDDKLMTMVKTVLGIKEPMEAIGPKVEPKDDKK